MFPDDVHPFELVTVYVNVPAVNPVAVEEVCPLLQRYVYVGHPLVTVIVALPSAAPLQLTLYPPMKVGLLAELVIGAGSVSVTVVCAPHPPASVIVTV